MDLKRYDRVIYKKNTIQEVICQLRYPTTLKINSPTDIAAFQDKIRAQYPEYQPTNSGLPSGIPEMLAQAGISNMGFPRGELGHHFLSEDHKLRLVLMQNSLTLVTDTYSRFEDFLNEFERALNALMPIFTFPYFTRVGLRYKNLIWCEFLGLGECAWKELIPNSIAPELHSAEYGDKVKFFDKKMLLIEGNERINISHTLTEVSGTFRDRELKEAEVYTIDADAFSEGKHGPDITAITTILRGFNVDLRSIFRASIMDKLHNAMEPTPP